MLENISSRVLHKAAQLKERIEGLTTELRQLIEGGSGLSVSVTVSKTPGKGPISAEGKARIIAAQKARWATYRKEQGTTEATTSAAKPKRKMSAAGRAKIAAAARLRWKKAKAAGKNSL